MTTRQVDYTDLVTVHIERTLPTTLSDSWELLVSCPDVWLGSTVRIEPDGRYAVDGCLESGHAHGRIEEVVLLERVVVTWSLEGWDDAALVEVAGVEAGPANTLVSVTVEDVPDHAAVADVVAHWNSALDRLSAAAEVPRHPQAA